MAQLWIRRALGALLISVVAAAGAVDAQAPPIGTCQHPTTISASDDASLRDAFNRARGSVRLIFLVDPICPTCLKGVKDLDTALLSPEAANASLQTFVIHTPVLGATESDTKNACALIHNEHVLHYWDPGQEMGNVFANAESMRKEEALIYAWDVWLVYGPEAQWTRAEPPKAVFRMHQVPDLVGRKDFPFLDASAFRDDVEKRLKALRAAPTP